MEELQKYALRSGNTKRLRSIVEDLLEEERVEQLLDGRIRLSETEARLAEEEARRAEEEARLAQEWGPLLRASMDQENER